MTALKLFSRRPTGCTNSYAGAVPFLLSKLDQPARLILVSRYASALSSSYPLLTIYT